MLQLPKWMLKIHGVLLLQLLLTPLSSVVHVPDTVQPQQSQTSLSTQAATSPSSCASSLSTPSSSDDSSTYSHVEQSSPWLNPCLHLLPFHRLRRPKGSVEQDQANFRVEPLLRDANVPVMFSPAKVVSLRRLSSVEESLSVSKRVVSQVKHILHGSGNTRSLVVLKRTSFWSLRVLRNIFCFRNPSFRTPTFICLVKWRIRLYLCALWLLKSLLWWLVYGNLCSLSNRFVNIDL